MTQTWRVVGKVANQRGLLFVDLVDVNHVDVSAHANRKRAAISKAKDARLRTGQHANGLGERERAFLSMPIRQHKGRPSCVDNLRQVRAGVAQAWENPVVLQELADRFVILVAEANVEERFTVSLQHHAQPGLGRVLACCFGDGGQTLIGAFGVFRRVTVAKPIEVARPGVQRR